MAVVFDSFKPLSYHILYKILLFCYLSFYSLLYFTRSSPFSLYSRLFFFLFLFVATFIFFFVWVYQRLRLVLHDESHLLFCIGLLVIVYVVIENVGSTFFSQSGGLYTMMLLGAIIGKYRHCTKEQRELILQQEYK